jgi:murein L,D-transpeptidase YafK
LQADGISCLLLCFLLWPNLAEARLVLEKQESEWAKIIKPQLPPLRLQERMDWLASQIPQRIPEITQQLKPGQTSISLVIYKQERQVELWIREPQFKKLKTYRMTAFSGKLGPKTRQGDKQIPEGIYRATLLNPNSRYYLSIGVNYPNHNDRLLGQKNQVKDLGGDIMIHGRNKTIGCVPIGDHFIEELFYIVGTVGLQNTRVVIAPTRLPLPPLSRLGLDAQSPLWIKKYAALAAELTQYL